MRSQVWEIRAVLVADRAHGAGRLGHDCVHVVREQVQRDFPFVTYLQVDVLNFILFIIHLLFLPADNAQVDENMLKGRFLQDPRSLELVSVVAVLVLVRDAAAGFVAAAVEVVDAVVADVAAEKDGVERIKLVLYF